MSAVAVAIGGAALIGAVSSSNAANSAASTQSNAAALASKTSQDQYDQTRADQAPWRQAGMGALTQMQDPKYQQNFSMSDFQQDPGYAFRMQQGQQAIERSAAARGGLNSGATMKALDTYSQGLGSQEYQSAYDRFNNDRTTTYNRLASLAGTGQTATAQTDAAGAANAQNISNNTMGAANAQSAATMAGANAINSAVGTGMNTWLGYQMMNKYGNSAGPTSASTGNTYAPSGDYSQALGTYQY